ncbi:MAG: DUF1552 domain-containing protein [Planctomycetota bacterium]|nr:DUF1552 domain-containing protein [Planctomycetota bacterium]
MNTRRDFLRNGLFGAGALACLDSKRLLLRPSTAPQRFIFMHRGNGLWPHVMVPPSFGELLMQREKRREAIDVDLDGHDLPDWMAPLEGHRDHLTILQGVSGKMCTTGHHSWCSALGAYKANERLSSILWATVDFELAKLYPSPVGHIELACFPLGGGNARGSLDGIAMGFSARGAQQPNYAFGSPKVAVEQLFQSVSEDPDAQVAYEIERRLLAFVARNEGQSADALRGSERLKVQGYVDSLEAIRERNRRIDGMADRIRQHVPVLDEAALSGDMTTFERQDAHAEVLLGALIAGLTNVVAFTVDELGHDYTGITGIEGERVNMHDVGHGKSFGGVEAAEIRSRCRTQHMRLIDRIATRLKAVPEGDGTMFDNTTILYFPDGGETHHSHGTEYPFVLVAGRNTRLALGHRYLRLPDYGQPGHRTLGNLHTTLLRAHGRDIEHYGALDTGLDKFGIDQKGPIPELLRG